MPVGGISAAAKDIADRKASGQGLGSRFFKVKDGQSKVVRFLEEGTGIHWCWTHKMPAMGQQKWGDDVPCINQTDSGEPCPGCEDGIPRKFKGFITLIERDAEKYATNADGRTDWSTVVGTEDAVAVWESGITVFEELDGLDADYKGLTTRDFKVTRVGSQLNTSYKVRPLDQAPMSEADQQLAANKPDLRGKITPSTYDDMRRRLNGAGGGSPASAPAVNAAPSNPFIDAA